VETNRRTRLFGDKSGEHVTNTYVCPIVAPWRRISEHTGKWQYVEFCKRRRQHQTTPRQPNRKDGTYSQYSFIPYCSRSAGPISYGMMQKTNHCPTRWKDIKMPPSPSTFQWRKLRWNLQRHQLPHNWIWKESGCKRAKLAQGSRGEDSLQHKTMRGLRRYAAWMIDFDLETQLPIMMHHRHKHCSEHNAIFHGLDRCVMKVSWEMVPRSIHPDALSLVKNNTSRLDSPIQCLIIWNSMFCSWSGRTASARSLVHMHGFKEDDVFRFIQADINMKDYLLTDYCRLDTQYRRQVLPNRLNLEVLISEWASRFVFCPKNQHLTILTSNSEHPWNRTSNQRMEASARCQVLGKCPGAQGGCPNEKIRWRNRSCCPRYGSKFTNSGILYWHGMFVGKQFGVSRARWPVKSAEFLLGLLKNAEANADTKGLDTGNLIVKHIQVNQAPKQRRRTYRAHGRVSFTICKCSWSQANEYRSTHICPTHATSSWFSPRERRSYKSQRLLLVVRMFDWTRDNVVAMLVLLSLLRFAIFLFQSVWAYDLGFSKGKLWLCILQRGVNLYCNEIAYCWSLQKRNDWTETECGPE